ncbi:hypothetical protein ELQ90_05200 [Labedella phragmitis]|uniref:Uncharacterized protein n=1 Tax=Labedella phragmitis TaxID=2498849 RepID=A0A444PUH7_9MICO|nr:hypothetical protein [Labedella phragmitis]RWZ51511.1 hypothetical protein ELQ90_05200 [Labedella phragmitis]
MSRADPAPHRVVLDLVRPRLSLHLGVRPTVVVDGRGQPAQWGVGTWQLPAGDTGVAIYLFNRIWRYGAAEARVPAGTTHVVYVAPWLPFGRGRITTSTEGPPVR